MTSTTAEDTSPVATGEPTSEDASRTAVRGLFGRDSLYMMLMATQIILAALLTPLTTRLLGATRFGLVASAIAVMQVLVAIGGFSLHTAVQRAYERDDGERKARQLVTFAINLALFTFAVVYATGELWSPSIGLGHFGPTIRYAVIWAALTAMSNAALGLIRSRDQLRWFATVSLLQSAVAEVLALGLVFLVHRTASEYMLGQMLGQAAAVVVALAVIRPRLLTFDDRPLLIDTLKYSSALVPAALSAYVLDASDRLVIHGDLGAAAVGRYAVARNIGGFALILLGVLNAVWMPRLFALKDRAVQREVIAAGRDGICVLAVAAMLGLTMVSPLLLWIWVPPSYHPGGLLLVTGLVAAAAVPTAGVMSAFQVLLLHNRTGSIAIGTVVAAILNLGLNLALVPRLGIDGSALITVCCCGLQWAILHRAAARVLPVRRPAAPLVLLIAISVGVCLASTALPLNGVGIALRSVLAIGAAMLFVAQLLSMVAPQRLERVQHLIGWLSVTRSRPTADTRDPALP